MEDRWNETEIICPYCGHVYSDSWEYGESEDDVICESCGKVFDLLVEHTTTYSTFMQKESE